MDVSDDDVSIALNDANGTLRVGIGHTSRGPGVVLAEEDGTPRAMVGFESNSKDAFFGTFDAELNLTWESG